MNVWHLEDQDRDCIVWFCVVEAAFLVYES